MILLSPTIASAQQFSFIHHSIEDGLAQSQVRAIAQDHRGYLWFATVGGVSRFDGRKYTNFSTSHGLIDNQVNCFFEDRENMLWLGCAGGVSGFNGTEFISYSILDVAPNTMVLDIAEEKTGVLLLATNGAGLLRLSLSSGKIEILTGLPFDALVRKLEFTPKGDLLIGARNGLFLAPNGELEKIQTIQENISVSDIAVSDDGRITVATFGDGIFIFDEDETINITEKSGLQNNFVREISRDREGYFWVASRSGLNKISPDGTPVFNTNIGLNYENIKTLFLDREDNLWVGTDGKGVYRLTGEQFVTFSRRDGLVSDIVMAIDKDDQGNMWFGSYDNGACLFNSEETKVFDAESGLIHNTIWCLLTAYNGDVWFGTNTGLSRFDGKQFINYSESEPGHFFERVTAIHQRPDSSIWFGTVDGIAVFHNERFLRSDELPAFPGTRVRYIYESAMGELWFGAENGLILLSNGEITVYDVPDGDKNSVVYNVTEDSNGNLWVGTKGGLYVMEDDELSAVTFSDGFGSNNINFLRIREEMLYIGTNNGLFVMDTEAHSRGVIRVQHYTDHEGLASLECNQNAVYLDDESRLWFGTTEGVIRYEVKHNPFDQSDLDPLVEISNIKLILEEKDWREFADSIDVQSGLPIGLELIHQNNHLTFEFVGLYFSNTEKVRYRYKLEGIDDDWLPETSTNAATYASLPHGEYTFRVGVRVDGGEWSNRESAFEFTILPPFYLTWWFITLAAVMVILGAAAFVFALLKSEQRKRHTQQLVYASRMLALEQQTLNSSMNRHFIFNALNSIQYYINRQDKRSANKYLSSFARLIRKNLDSSQENFTSLADEIERIELYLELENMRFPDKFTYRIEVDPSIDTHSVTIPAMLFQPYLENSIWHGILPMKSAGKIEVKVTRKGEDLEIKIEDNGIGIDASRKQRDENSNAHIPQGMLINQNRIDLFRKMTDQNFKIEGPFDMKKSNPEASGTVVAITFPLKTSLQNTLSA